MSRYESFATFTIKIPVNNISMEKAVNSVVTSLFHKTLFLMLPLGNPSPVLGDLYVFFPFFFSLRAYLLEVSDRTWWLLHL